LRRHSLLEFLNKKWLRHSLSGITGSES